MKELISDHMGNISSMRVMSFISLFNSVALSWFAINNNVIESAQFLIGTFLLFAFAPKAAQHFSEMKFNPKV